MTIKYVFELNDNGDGMFAKVTNCKDVNIIGRGETMPTALDSLCRQVENTYQSLKGKEELTDEEHELLKFLKSNRYKDSGWYLERVS